MNKNQIFSLLFSCLLFFLIFSVQAAAQTVTLISDDPDINRPTSIATDGTHLFVGGTDPSNVWRIWRVPIGGGPTTRLYQASQCPHRPCHPLNMIVLGNDLFFIDPNSGPSTDTQILKAPKDGSGPITAIYTGAFQGQPIVDGSGITTDGTKLYTADEVQGRVHRLNPDGSGLTFLGSRFGGFFNTERYHSIVHDNGTLFIADGGRSGVAGPTIVSLPVTGGGFTTLHSGAPLFVPSDIAIFNDQILVLDIDINNTIWSMPKTGGTPTVFFSGPPFIGISRFIAFNGVLYVVDSGAGKIYSIQDDPGLIKSVQTGPDELDQLNTSVVPPPDSITIENLMTCGNDPLVWELNGQQIAGFNAGNSHCTCNPPLQSVNVADQNLINSAWNAQGQNLMRFTKNSTGTAFAWTRVILDRGGQTETHCVFDQGGGNCDVNNLCSANYTFGTIDASLEINTGPSTDGEIDVAILAGDSASSDYSFTIRHNNPDLDAVLIEDTISSDWWSMKLPATRSWPARLAGCNRTAKAGQWTFLPQPAGR